MGLKNKLKLKNSLWISGVSNKVAFILVVFKWICNIYAKLPIVKWFNVEL